MKNEQFFWSLPFQTYSSDYFPIDRCIFVQHEEKNNKADIHQLAVNTVLI